MDNGDHVQKYPLSVDYDRVGSGSGMAILQCPGSVVPGQRRADDDGDAPREGCVAVVVKSGDYFQRVAIATFSRASPPTL
jgi:hypothetical protein